jgi:hypothetical protein
MAFRKGKKTPFKYRGTNSKFMTKHIASGGRDYDSMFKIDVTTFKPRDAENKIRVVPPTSDEMDYWALPIHVHYGVGADNASYLCPRKHGGKKCPICEDYERARKAGKDEEAKELRPNQRFLTYLVDRKDEEKGIQVWSMPGKLDGELSKQTVDPETREILQIDNPTAGYDIYFTKEGQGLKTQYTGCKLARKTSDLDDESVLEFAQKHPLPEILQVYSYEHILKEYEGSSGRSDDDDDADEEDDERPRKKKHSDDEDLDDDVPFEGDDDDDDEDDGEEGDEEDGESEGHARRSAKSRGRTLKKRSRRDDSGDDSDDSDNESEDGDDEDEDSATQDAAFLRKANLSTLKSLAKEHNVKWATLRAQAEEEEWDDTKLKIRLRRKIAAALDIDLE